MGETFTGNGERGVRELAFADACGFLQGAFERFEGVALFLSGGGNHGDGVGDASIFAELVHIVEEGTVGSSLLG